MNTTKSIFRIRVVLVVIVSITAFLFWRLGYIQFKKTEYYKKVAESQYKAPKLSSFDRGSIFFQDKKGALFSAAMRLTGYTLAISPKDIKNEEEAFLQLSAVYTPLSKDAFLEKAAKKKDPHEEVAKKLTLADKKNIEALHIKGVYLYPEYFRMYPYNSLAAQTLGFVGWSGDTLSGRYGLERYYNDVLSRSGEGVSVNVFAEIFSDISKTLFSRESEKEGDLILTIEPNVQIYAEEILAGLHKDWNSDTAGVIVMDPNTGKIIAMAGTPTFNPNDLKDSTVSSFVNPLVENVYEMGSIIKPLTFSAGIDTGVITPESHYNDTGDLLISGLHVRNFDHRARGYIGIQEALGQSLNVGTVWVAEKIGGERFKKYMLSYGFDTATGIDVPNEATSLARNLHSNIEVDYLTTSFGQGMAVSPIQTVRALAALGNGGTLVTPYLVDKIEYKTGSTKTIVQNEGQRVIKKETSEAITRMLVKVVDTDLKKGRFSLPEYSVAAKTGTAQIARPHGGYYEDRYLHSFFGYFPAYKPKFIVFIFHTWPKNAKYASETLTEPFFKIAKFLLSYYEVPPDRDVKLHTVQTKQ